MALINDDEHCKPVGTLVNFDPRLVDMLRSALAAVGEEQRMNAGAVSAPEEKAAKKDEKKEKKPEEPPLFWKLCSAALVSVSALVAVTLYNQLSAGASQVRGDLGQMRSELGQMRTDLVVKDDYHARNERTVDLIKQVQANNKGSMDTWRELLQDQKMAATELRLQIKELERELHRIRERQQTLEQREFTAPDLRSKKL